MPKYGPKAKLLIERTMREYHRGELKSGSDGEKVTSRDQALAIGIDKARKKGYKVPKESESKED